MTKLKQTLIIITMSKSIKQTKDAKTVKTVKTTAPAKTQGIPFPKGKPTVRPK